MMQLQPRKLAVMLLLWAKLAVSEDSTTSPVASLSSIESQRNSLEYKDTAFLNDVIDFIQAHENQETHIDGSVGESAQNIGQQDILQQDITQNDDQAYQFPDSSSSSGYSTETSWESRVPESTFVTENVQMSAIAEEIQDTPEDVRFKIEAFPAGQEPADLATGESHDSETPDLSLNQHESVDVPLSASEEVEEPQAYDTPKQTLDESGQGQDASAENYQLQSENNQSEEVPASPSEPEPSTSNESSVTKQDITIELGAHLRVLGGDEDDCEEEEDDCEDEEEDDDCEEEKKKKFWFFPFALDRNLNSSNSDPLEPQEVSEDSSSHVPANEKILLSPDIILSKASPDTHGLFTYQQQQPGVVSEATIGKSVDKSNGFHAANFNASGGGKKKGKKKTIIKVTVPRINSTAFPSRLYANGSRNYSSANSRSSARGEGSRPHGYQAFYESSLATVSYKVTSWAVVLCLSPFLVAF